MTLKTKSFNIAEHLNTPEEIRSFLQEVATTGDEYDFISPDIKTRNRAVFRR